MFGEANVRPIILRTGFRVVSDQPCPHYSQAFVNDALKQDRTRTEKRRCNINNNEDDDNSNDNMR